MLQSNLQEIYHAVKFSGKHLCLTANMSGTRIYDSTRGWGRLWRWFYRIFDNLTFIDYRLAKLKQAIIHTHCIFQTQLHSVQQDLSGYTTYLKRLGSGYSVAEETMHALRQRIQKWNRSTLPFLNLMQGCQHPKLDQIFRLCFGEHIEFSTLWSNAEVTRIEAAGKVIDLEGLSQGPLPLAVIKKILRTKPLNTFDRRELDRWINRLNQSPDCVERLYAALRAILNIYLKDHQTPSLEILRLGTCLEDYGCQVFRQSDKQHIVWRSGLKNGTVLNSGKQQWVLGSQIPFTKMDADNTLIFSTDNSAEVILVAHNKVVLGMRHHWQEKHNNYGLEPAHFEVYEEGRWAVMEKLDSVVERNWQSVSGQSELHSDDVPLVHELSDLIGKFVKKEKMPLKFCADALMYDPNYRLKYLNVDMAAEVQVQNDFFDFNALEDFVFACAGNNLAVFKHLMTASGLAMHPTGEFYHELIKNALKGDQTSVEDMAGIYKILDPNVVIRGAALLKEVCALRDLQMLKLRQAHPDKDKKAILLEANARLLHSHKATAACGRLFPTN